MARRCLESFEMNIETLKEDLSDLMLMARHVLFTNELFQEFVIQNEMVILNGDTRTLNNLRGGCAEKNHSQKEQKYPILTQNREIR